LIVDAMHYKLRVVGVLIDGPANVFCDNCGVMIYINVYIDKELIDD
jgi:hypothetical protein